MTVSVLLLLAPGFTSSALGPEYSPTRIANYQWTLIQGWGAGVFQESWRQGKVPLAVKPLLGPEGKLWMIGGRGVWSSGDGSRWTRVAEQLPWGDRYGAEASFHRGELWVAGGEEGRVRRNDVYRSRDGVHWHRLPAPPWSARRGHTLTAFKDRLWITGGSDSRSRSDVWESDDGARWRLVTDRSRWPARAGHTTVVWQDLLCIAGGVDQRTALNDVWCSKEGRRWSHVRAGPVPARMYPGVLVFADKLWVFGGSAAGVAGDDAWLNDVWALSSGKQWVRENQHAPWSRRAPQYSVVFRDRIWLYGGKGIEANGRGGFADDIWTFGKP